MKKLLSALISAAFLAIPIFSTVDLGVQAKIVTTTFDLTVYQIVVEDEDASISGPAAGVDVSLYDNLGERALARTTSSPDGKVKFILDEEYPLSALGLYHVLVKVAGKSKGIYTCQQGETCQQVAFTVKGLNPTLDDAVLVVEVVRSPDLKIPVEGIKMIVTRADDEGNPEPVENVNTGGRYINRTNLPCISNADGFCVTYLNSYYQFTETYDRIGVANITIQVGQTVTYDANSVKVNEGEVTVTSIAVDDNGNLDDCSFRLPPMNKMLNTSCKEKIHQTATAEAAGPMDSLATETYNNAMVQASLLSKDTQELFLSHEPDSNKIADQLARVDLDSFDPDTQVKLIIYVNVIITDGYGAAIIDPAIGELVEITRPDDPDDLLSACQVNDLGECVSILDRAELREPDGLLKFRVIADGYDNSILLCRDESICIQHAYTVFGLLGIKDAVLLYKAVREDDHSIPVQGVQITAGMGPRYYRGCNTDENGFCVIAMDDKEFTWEDDGNGYYANAGADVEWFSSLDASTPRVRDNSLAVFYLAIDDLGKVADCTFASPLEYEPSFYRKNPDCAAKKKILQTAIAGYTATPTITVTPTVTLTPTITATPLPSATPTATLIPTPTPMPGLFAGESAPLAMGGIVLLIVLLGGGAWLILRARNKRS